MYTKVSKLQPCYFAQKGAKFVSFPKKFRASQARREVGDANNNYERELRTCTLNQPELLQQDVFNKLDNFLDLVKEPV